MSSALEHGVIELIHPDSKAISTVKAIAYANNSGLNIYRITSENIDTVLQNLVVSSETTSNIENAVNAGKEILVPETTIQYYDWIGDGYIVFDPETGAGDYVISGGLYGGSSACSYASNKVPIDDSDVAFRGYGDVATLSGGTGSCSVDKAQDYIQILTTTRDAILAWAAKADPQTAASLSAFAVAIGAIISALITVAMYWNELDSISARVFLFLFIFGVTVLAASFIGFIFAAGTAIAGPAGIGLGLFVSIPTLLVVNEITDRYMELLKEYDKLISYIPTRRRNILKGFAYAV
jgi:hypothetical protein